MLHLQCRNYSSLMSHGEEMTNFLKCICNIINAWNKKLSESFCWKSGCHSWALYLRLLIISTLCCCLCGKEAFPVFQLFCCANNRKAVCVCDSIARPGRDLSHSCQLCCAVFQEVLSFLSSSPHRSPFHFWLISSSLYIMTHSVIYRSLSKQS